VVAGETVVSDPPVEALAQAVPSTSSRTGGLRWRMDSAPKNVDDAC